jgi:hypothetical protein
MATGLEAKHKECAMKSLITSGVLIAALALGGNAAVAANAPAHRSAKPVPRAHIAVRAAPRGADNRLGVDVGQFIQSMLGGGWPAPYSRLVQDAMRAQPSHRSSGSSDWSSPSYDTSSAASSSASDSQAASDAENQAIQSMNDTNALNASMAAAEAANDAANAATLQTEINAGM